ncbi:MAG: hypothetical protein CMJ76_04270 [Planctomycetaceae bacterium]|nr:hypothetical protein [Planctomycetaceae bacterium]
MQRLTYIGILLLFASLTDSVLEAAPRRPKYSRPRPSRNKTVMVEPVLKKPAGPRKTVAVWPKYQPGFKFPGVDELVVDELVNSEAFTVVERLNIEALESEANMFENVRHIGAQLIFEVVVSDVDQRSSQGLQFGLGELGLGGDGFDVVVGTSRTTAKATVVIRVIETSSGKIIASHRADGTSVGSGLNLGFAYQDARPNKLEGFDINFGKIENTSVGKAVAKAVKLAVTRTANKVNSHPWEARVADFDEQFVYLNAGTNAGLKVGSQLSCNKSGKIISDPQTGEVLDVVTIPVCTLEVVSVKEKIAVCRIINGDTNPLIEKNMIVTLKTN